MSTLAPTTDERVASVDISDGALRVALRDGRTITAPLGWFPRLANASQAEQANWQISGGGYGIHWPQIDEDISVHGLLAGVRAPEAA